MMVNQIVIIESEKEGVVELCDVALKVLRMNEEVSIDILTNDSRIERFTDPADKVRIKLPSDVVIPEWYRLTGFQYGYDEGYDYNLHYSDVASCEKRDRERARIKSITESHLPPSPTPPHNHH